MRTRHALAAALAVTAVLAVPAQADPVTVEVEVTVDRDHTADTLTLDGNVRVEAAGHEAGTGAGDTTVYCAAGVTGRAICDAYDLLP